MEIYNNLKITAFFQITQSILLVLIYNVLLASVFPPNTVNDVLIPDINYILSSQIIGFLFTAITLVVLFKVYQINEYTKLDLSIKGILYAFLALVAAIIIINAVDNLQKLLIPIWLKASLLSTQQELMNDYKVLANMLINIHPAMLYLVGALLPAICEEFFFRGYLLQLMLKRFSYTSSIITVSLIFALMHFQVVAFIPLFIFGIILSVLTLKTQRIIYAVIVHFANNAITLYIVTNV